MKFFIVMNDRAQMKHLILAMMMLAISQAVGATNKKEPIQISGCRITDYPRFQWRGLMLDVSRGRLGISI